MSPEEYSAYVRALGLSLIELSKYQPKISDETGEMVYRRLEGTLLPSPKSPTTNPLPQAENFRFERYSTTSGELFWDGAGTPVIGYRVTRDGTELTTRLATSWFMDDLVAGRGYTFGLQSIGDNSALSPAQVIVYVPSGSSGDVPSVTSPVVVCRLPDDGLEIKFAMSEPVTVAGSYSADTSLSLNLPAITSADLASHTIEIGPGYDGTDIYLEITGQSASGVEYSIGPATYQIVDDTRTSPSFTSPAPGVTIADENLVVTWTAGDPADVAFDLDLYDSEPSDTTYSSGNIHAATGIGYETTYTIPSSDLPKDGRDLWLRRLDSRPGGTFFTTSIDESVTEGRYEVVQLTAPTVEATGGGAQNLAGPYNIRGVASSIAALSDTNVRGENDPAASDPSSSVEIEAAYRFVAKSPTMESFQVYHIYKSTSTYSRGDGGVMRAYLSKSLGGTRISESADYIAAPGPAGFNGNQSAAASRYPGAVWNEYGQSGTAFNYFHRHKMGDGAVPMDVGDTYYLIFENRTDAYRSGDTAYCSIDPYRSAGSASQPGQKNFYFPTDANFEADEWTVWNRTPQGWSLDPSATNRHQAVFSIIDANGFRYGNPIIDDGREWGTGASNTNNYIEGSRRARAVYNVNETLTLDQVGICAGRIKGSGSMAVVVKKNGSTAWSGSISGFDTVSTSSNYHEQISQSSWRTASLPNISVTTGDQITIEESCSSGTRYIVPAVQNGPYLKSTAGYGGFDEWVGQMTTGSSWSNMGTSQHAFCTFVRTV